MGLTNGPATRVTNDAVAAALMLLRLGHPPADVEAVIGRQYPDCNQRLVASTAVERHQAERGRNDA